VQLVQGTLTLLDALLLVLLLRAPALLLGTWLLLTLVLLTAPHPVFPHTASCIASCRSYEASHVQEAC
jgi:hypothetical protein